MTRNELIDKLARLIAEKEGFYVTEAQAKGCKIRYPTLAQLNANPGNIRTWKDAHGRPYPASQGYVDFVAWASDRFRGATRESLSARALEEGWRVLRVLVGKYLEGKYTLGKPPTITEMFQKYAPASDHNDPAGYASFVASKLGASPETRLLDLILA